MKYTVHQGYYCPSRNVYVYPGVYEEADIDVVMARRYTQISPANLDVEAPKVQTHIDQVRDVILNPDPDGFKELNLVAEVAEVKVKKLKINSAKESEIAAVKYVSKKNAADAVEKRAGKQFESYEDLDTRVPLAFKRKWQDLTVIDFELKDTLTQDDLVNKY